MAIKWLANHIERHKDEEKAAEDLNKWARLNIEMDSLAKQHIAVAKQRPRHFCIKHELWAVWTANTKLVKDLNTNIYNLVHSEEAKQYWIGKQRIEPLQSQKSTV